MHIARRDEESRNAVGDEFWNAANRKRHDRQTGRECLDDRQRISLPSGRESEDISAGEHIGDVVS